MWGTISELAWSLSTLLKKMNEVTLTLEKEVYGYVVYTRFGELLCNGRFYGGIMIGKLFHLDFFA